MILLLFTLSYRFYCMLLQNLSIYRFVIDTSLFTAPLNVASDTVVQRVPSICLLLCARCTLKGVRHTHTHTQVIITLSELSSLVLLLLLHAVSCHVPTCWAGEEGVTDLKGMLSKRRGNRSSNNCVHHPPRGRNGNFLFHAFSFRAWHGDMFCAFAFAPLPPPALQSPSLCHGRPSSPSFSHLPLPLSCLQQLLFSRHAARNASSDSHTASHPTTLFPLPTYYLCPRWSLQTYSHRIPFYSIS